MKLHEIKQTLVADKFYVYNMDKKKIVSGPFDGRTQATMTFSGDDALTVKRGRELMSVTEATLQSVELKDIDLWDEAGLESVDVEVEFDYEPPVAQQQPYGQGYAIERLGAVVDIATVRLTKEANIVDEDEKVVRVLKKGTDLMKEPFYKTKDTKWLSDQIAEKFGD